MCVFISSNSALLEAKCCGICAIDLNGHMHIAAPCPFIAFIALQRGWYYCAASILSAEGFTYSLAAALLTLRYVNYLEHGVGEITVASVWFSLCRCSQIYIQWSILIKDNVFLLVFLLSICWEMTHESWFLVRKQNCMMTRMSYFAIEEMNAIHSLTILYTYF